MFSSFRSQNYCLVVIWAHYACLNTPKCWVHHDATLAKHSKMKLSTHDIPSYFFFGLLISLASSPFRFKSWAPVIDFVSRL